MSDLTRVEMLAAAEEINQHMTLDPSVGEQLSRSNIEARMTEALFKSDKIIKGLKLSEETQRIISVLVVSQEEVVETTDPQKEETPKRSVLRRRSRGEGDD